MFAATTIRFWLTATAAAQLAEKKGEGYNVQWKNGAPFIDVNPGGVHGIDPEHVEKISLSAVIADGGLLRGVYMTEEEDVLVFVDTLPNGSQSVEVTGHDLPEMLAFYTGIRAGTHLPCDNWEHSREERMGSTATISLEDLMGIFLESLEKNGCEVRLKKVADEAPADTQNTAADAATGTTQREELAKGMETEAPDHPRSA